MGDKDLSMKARKFLLKFVINFTRENWEKLNVHNADVNENIVADLKKDAWVLDWILGEVLANDYFKELGITQKYGWEGDGLVAIYKIKNRIVRQTRKRSEVTKNPSTFEFVKLKKKIIYEYEVVNY